MTLRESNILVPNGTFFIELLVVLLLISAAVWWLVRTLRRHFVADELARLARLRDAGIVDNGEFERAKAKLLD